MKSLIVALLLIASVAHAEDQEVCQARATATYSACADKAGVASDTTCENALTASTEVCRKTGTHAKLEPVVSRYVPAAPGTNVAVETTEQHEKAIAAVNLACGLSARPDSDERRAAIPCVNRMNAERREIRDIQARMDKLTKPDWAHSMSLAELDAVVAPTLTDANRVNDIARDFKQPAALDPLELEKAMRADIAREKSCRVDKKCMTARVEADKRAQAHRWIYSLCDLESQRRESVQEDKEERANPSGYVDIRRLHDIGFELQRLAHETGEAAKQYRAIMGKPFTIAECHE